MFFGILDEIQYNNEWLTVHLNFWSIKIRLSQGTGLHVFCQGTCCISSGVHQNQILLRTVNSPYDYLMAHNLSFLCVASRVFAPVLMLILFSFLLHSTPPPFNISSSDCISTYTFVQKTANCVSPALCSQILSPWLGGYSWLWCEVVVQARQATLAGGTVRQPYARVDYIPQSGTMILTGKNLCRDVARSTENGMVWPLPGCE